MKKQRKIEKDNRGVAIYARKSRITNKGDSIGVQFKQCADYAKKELGLDEEYEFLQYECSRSKFLSKLLKTFDKTFREIFPVFISTKRREKPSAFFDNNFVNNAYFSEAASSSSSHLASSSSKAPISSRMTCLCLWSS